MQPIDFDSWSYLQSWDNLPLNVFGWYLFSLRHWCMEFTFKNKNTYWMQKDMSLLTGTRLHFYDLFWMSVYLNIPTTLDDAWLLYTRNFFLVHPCWLLQNSNFDFFRAFLFLYCQTQVDTMLFQKRWMAVWKKSVFKKWQRLMTLY